MGLVSLVSWGVQYILDFTVTSFTQWPFWTSMHDHCPPDTRLALVALYSRGGRFHYLLLESLTLKSDGQSWQVLLLVEARTLSLVWWHLHQLSDSDGSLHCLSFSLIPFHKLEADLGGTLPWGYHSFSSSLSTDLDTEHFLVIAFPSNCTLFFLSLKKVPERNSNVMTPKSCQWQSRDFSHPIPMAFWLSPLYQFFPNCDIILLVGEPILPEACKKIWTNNRYEF